MDFAIAVGLSNRTLMFGLILTGQCLLITIRSDAVGASTNKATGGVAQWFTSYQYLHFTFTVPVARSTLQRATMCTVDAKTQMWSKRLRWVRKRAQRLIQIRVSQKERDFKILQTLLFLCLCMCARTRGFVQLCVPHFIFALHSPIPH